MGVTVGGVAAGAKEVDVTVGAEVNGVAVDMPVGIDCTCSTAGDTGEPGNEAMSMSNAGGGVDGPRAKGH